MPCGDAGRERHTWSYLLIATNKQPFVPWRGTGSEVSPSPGWSHQHPPLPALPRSVTRPDGQRIHMDTACLVAAPGQAHLPLRHDGMGSDQPSAKTLLLYVITLPKGRAFVNSVGREKQGEIAPPRPFAHYSKYIKSLYYGGTARPVPRKGPVRQAVIPLHQHH